MNSGKKAAVVTGASSGIGYEIAQVLLEKGYEVFGFGMSFKRECRFNAIESESLIYAALASFSSLLIVEAAIFVIQIS